MIENHEDILRQTEHIISHKKKVTINSLHANNHNIWMPAKFGINGNMIIARFENFVKTNLRVQRKDSHVIRTPNRGDQNNC